MVFCSSATTLSSIGVIRIFARVSQLSGKLTSWRCCNLGFARCQDRLNIQHRVTLLHVALLATLLASGDLLILCPRCDRRNRSASPKAAFLRTYVLGGSGNGRRAPKTAHPPAPPPAQFL